MSSEQAVRRQFMKGCAVGAIVMILLLVLLVVAAFFISRPFIPGMLAKGLSAPALPTGLADYSWTLKDPDGKPFPLATVKGKPAVLFLWKPGCDACAAELPSVQKLADTVEANGVAILCIALKSDEDVAAEAARAGLRLPYYTYDGKIPDVFKPKAVPTTFVIDAEGHIVMNHKGAAKWDDPTVVNFLLGLTADAAAKPDTVP